MSDLAESPFRCGFVAVVGRPNVGKSTLINKILDYKLSITSRKPQTTRHRILGIKTTPRTQAIFVDTPGIHAGGKRALNRYLNRTAVGALDGVDVVIMMVEALQWTRGDDLVIERLKPSEAPVLLAVNKVDRVPNKPDLLPYLERVSGRMPFVEIVPISARQAASTARLEGLIERYLPIGERVFPPDQITDRSERFLVGELVREKLVRKLGQELPHRLTVEIEHFEEHDHRTVVGAIVWIESRSQKPIVVGRDGTVLKAAGTAARQDIERLLGRAVHLDLWVKVKTGWSDDEQALARLGYSE